MLDAAEAAGFASESSVLRGLFELQERRSADGGLVEGIVADRPIKVRVVDYDVEGADPDGLVLVPQDKGDSIPAAASGWGVDSICVDAEWITRLDAAIASEN